MHRIHADLILVACAAVWGLAFVFQKTAMLHTGPLLFIACRAIVAALALLPVAVLEARRSATGNLRDLVRISAVAGLAFFVAAVLQQVGLVTASVTNAGFLTALYVVFVPFIAWAWHRRAPNPLIWPAVAISFAGTWLLGGGSIGGLTTGDVLIAVSAVFWAAHVVVLGVSGRLGRPVGMTALQFVVVGVLALAAAFLFEQPSLVAIRAAWIEIAFVGLLSSALTFTLLAVALRYTPPSEAAVLVSLETVFAALSGALLLGDRLTLIGWIGAGMIFTATLLIQLRAGRAEPKLARPSP